MGSKFLLGCFITVLSLAAQESAGMRDILKRLDRLEEQNRELMSEIHALRQQLASTRGTPEIQPAAPESPPLEERVNVHQQRIEDLEQTKVGAEQKLPVTLTGTVLFNAYRNGRNNGDQLNPVVASPSAASNTGGATMRQTIIGLKFRGPEIAGGGKVSGSLYMDLFGGTGTSLNQMLRLRVATIDAAWKYTTLSFGQDKPIISPREPDSLAQVGVSPLTAAGNLWLWEPQARIEQRVPFGQRAGLQAQVGLYQTSESGAGVPAEYADTLARSRPGWEGRFLFWKEHGEARFEVAPGFHYSKTHVLGQTAPSRIYSVDWLIRPVPRFDFTGQFFQGVNVGVLGALRQSIQIREPYDHIESVASWGGWGQFTFRATPRLSFHVYGGQQDDRNSQLSPGAIGKNQAYAANVMYRFGPNVLAAFEASQVRTTYLGGGTTLNPHYDLALAYLF